MGKTPYRHPIYQSTQLSSWLCCLSYQPTLLFCSTLRAQPVRASPSYQPLVTLDSGPAYATYNIPRGYEGWQVRVWGRGGVQLTVSVRCQVTLYVRYDDNGQLTPDGQDRGSTYPIKTRQRSQAAGFCRDRGLGLLRSPLRTYTQGEATPHDNENTKRARPSSVKALYTVA